MPKCMKTNETIKQNSTIRTIRDILMDKDHKELRGVPQVGAYWTSRIFSYKSPYIVSFI